MQSVFYYGVMKASKSAQLILKASTYQKQGIEPIIIKPTTDTRDGGGIVHSRIGIEMPATYTIEPDDIDKVIEIGTLARHQNRPIFVDEAQFFEPSVLKCLLSTTTVWNNNEDLSHVNVYLYGLLKDFSNELFDGTKAIIENVDKMSEIKTQCEEPSCGRKATCNFLNHRDVLSDAKFIVGDKNYHVYCQTHYIKHMKEGRC